MGTGAPDFIVLDGARCSVVLELAHGEAPLWRYWGPRLEAGAMPPGRLRSGRALPSFSLDLDQPLSLFPGFGAGWFGPSALLAHRGGQDFAQGVTECQADWIEPGRAVRLRMRDDVAALQVNVTLRLDPSSDVLTCQTTLTNTGAAALDVQWLAAVTLPLPGDARSVRYFSGRHNNEFQLHEDVLGRAQWRRENRRGLTSHDCFPGAVITMPGTVDGSGLAYGAQLAWSGNHAQAVDWIDDGQYGWQLGEWLAPGEVRLEPGEAIKTPEVLATCSEDGLNGVAANFHTAIRQRMTWPGGTRTPRPVHLNTWEGVYFDLDEAGLMVMATEAAEVGIERFVLDDGWFHGRRNDRAGLGDWWVDRGVFPNGLAPLANHVTGLGMQFGLWVEPEMINPDSDLFRAHPDWALQIAGRAQLTARNQLVLDMANPEVTAYLIEKIGALLDTLPIRYLKWDHNRDLTTAGSGGRAAYRRQTLAAYGLFDAIRTRWPNVEIEACAGGGGRIDAGILQHTHRVWTSDCIDAVSRVTIQRGFLQFFPPEIMGAHIGTSPAHTTGRRQSMAFRAAVALPGHLGVELKLSELDEAARAGLKQWIGAYKGWRELLHGGHVWLGDAGDGTVWQAHGHTDDLIVFVYRVEPTRQRWAPALVLGMVDAQRRYHVHDVTPGLRRGSGETDWLRSLREEGAGVHGDWIRRAGLALPPMKAEQCLVLRLTAE